MLQWIGLGTLVTAGVGLCALALALYVGSTHTRIATANASPIAIQIAVQVSASRTPTTWAFLWKTPRSSAIITTTITPKTIHNISFGKVIGRRQP